MNTRRRLSDLPCRLGQLTVAAVLLWPASGLALPSCGDANGNGATSASDALLVLRKAVGAPLTCPACACDVNADTAISASDSLAVLRRAVGVTRYLACMTSADCAPSVLVLDDSFHASADVGALLELETGGVVEDAVHRVRLFAPGVLSIEIPAVIAEDGLVAAAMPPLAGALAANAWSGSAAGAPPLLVQIVAGSGETTTASNAVAGLDIAALPDAPGAAGFVTHDFLLGAIERGAELLDAIDNASDPALDGLRIALEDSLAALATLDELLTAVAAGTPTVLGSLSQQQLVLTAADVAQVDAMLMALLLARAEHVDSAALLSPRAGGLCGQEQATAYTEYLLHPDQAPPARHDYASAPCAAQGFKTGYAVALGPAALAAGLLALGGASAIALSLPAAAVLYVTVLGAGGLIAVGGLLGAGTPGAASLVKEGVDKAEAAMRSIVQGAVLPDVTGTLAEMASAVTDLSEAFAGVPPPTTSTTTTSTTTTTTTTTTTLGGNGCWCCCAFWDDVHYTCQESGSPQQPGSGEANCFYYDESLELCGTGFCES